MKSDRFARLQGLIAEALRKKGLLEGLATRTSGKRDECEEQWKKLQGLAGAQPVDSIDATTWDQLSSTKQDEVLSGLTTLIAGLDGVLEEEEPTGWLMSKHLVGTKMIVFLALFGFALTGSVLWIISMTWRQAIQQPHVEASVQAEKKRLDVEIGRLTRDAPSQPALNDELEIKRRELAALTNLPELVRKAMSVPEEGMVLRMVMYMGMLGGCLHLLASLVRYVGDRELRRSWLLYYMAVPVQGAGLALLIYLLLRVGVLAPNENGNGGIAQANLIGIYAFAGLTGMFAKAATEKLGEVFLTLFRTQRPAGDSVREQPKPNQG